ncbi:sulfonate transport system permease protein [Xanthobacter flavus]|uniref:ABC transporter permease n=1 Tax=Xanthobacter flavus TaxID=281 RepID=A0A9W6CMN2_XANFL|nr:ABC transporter permease subunit [Xanthobacter flavus]MDR6336436.1 sulfonate transport system permease protein [Xanthobacter flavus]GLI25213.1 ABC transporter permease [Xanthobacter flavus]
MTHAAPASIFPAAGKIALKRTPRQRESRLRLAGADAARLVLPLALLAIWQGACSFGFISPRTLESPVAVVGALVELTLSGVLWESLVASFKRASAGFLVGGGLGLVLGIVAGLWRTGERAYDALLQMLRMVPFLAVIPLFVIWFGVDEEPKVLLIALACIFPVYLNTFSGVRNVDPKIIEAATVFGMSRVAIATEIVAPLALPSIMVGVRYAMGVALLSLVAAEQVNATSGIGYLALNPRASLRTDIILGVVLLYSVLGLAVDFLIRTAQSRLLPWHRSVLEKAR